MAKQRSWSFLRSGAMSVPADSMANPLRNTQLTKPELLMREAVQNSADERVDDSDEPVRFVVSRSELRGEDKARVVDLLQLSTIRERAESFGNRSHGWFNDAQGTIETLDDPEVPFSILRVSDYNTKGLGGRWNDEGDIENRFHNLVMSLLSSEKLNDETSNLLGSYGVGKMVFALSSKIRTMAYYSVFEPTERTDNNHARFMATGFFPGHKTEDGNSWTGHGFLGEKSRDKHYPTRPIVDKDAHEFVEAMGFERRTEDETGTTVFLLDCSLSVEDCRDACEKYWWPRLLDPKDQKYIDLEFEDQGRPISGVKIGRNPIIRPFVECYRVQQATSKVLPGYELHSRVPKNGNKGGVLCLKQVDGKAAEGNLLNSVALVRGGLVIRYERDYAKEGSPEVVGVFTASSDNLRAFTYSEPEAHDNWIETQDRLLQAMGEAGQTLIKRTHRSIKGLVRDFQTRLEDRKETKLADDADFLDQILGPIFDKKPKRPEPPEPSERAISIHKSGRHENRKGQLIQILDVAVAIADVVDVELATAMIGIDFKPLISANEAKGPSVPRKIYSPDGKILADEAQGKVEVTIEKGHRTEMTAEAVCHPAWKANWVVTVTANPASSG